jgi:pilus assembly protein Flp/PilA
VIAATVFPVRRKVNSMRNDKGQTAVEYLGIIAVVVAIVLAITGTDIGNTIYTAITDKINEVVGG